MSAEPELRIYTKKEVIFFRTTSGAFGGLSNMAPDFPIVLVNVRIPTAEALYQACRFPDDPDVQRIIIDQMSPMTAKMKSKKHRSRTRADWIDVRVRIMRWCLRAKLASNWSRFGAILDQTGDKSIVEESTKDQFWGAKPSSDGTLVGMNVLGRLLMELREQFRGIESNQNQLLDFPEIPHFLLLGSELLPPRERNMSPRETQPFMFSGQLK